MEWLPDGYYLGIGYEECEEYETKDGLQKRCKYVDTVRLNISSFNQLYDAVHYSEPLDFHTLHDLNKNDIENLIQYIDTKIEIDFNRYDYYLEVCVEDWLQEERDKGKRKRLNEYIKTLPDPKFVFALLVYDKEDEDSDVLEMPLFDIDANEVRQLFNAPPEPELFKWHDRLDKKMYDFIASRIKCNNIMIDKYDYWPIIRYNNYDNLDDVIVIPCHINDGDV